MKLYKQIGIISPHTCRSKITPILFNAKITQYIIIKRGKHYEEKIIFAKYINCKLLYIRLKYKSKPKNIKDFGILINKRNTSE